MTASTEPASRIVKAQAEIGPGSPVAFDFDDLRRACDAQIGGVRGRSRESDAAARLTIRLSPQDVERLGDSIDRLRSEARGLGEAEVLADPAVSPGSCLLETRHGRIDRRLEALLGRIGSELTPGVSGPGRRLGGAAATGRTSPTISVVIPTYNYARYLRRAVDSALGQSEPPHEVIVVDDGSTDGTPAVAATFAAPVRCLRQSNAGPSAARNRGVDAATGDYVVFLDADDRLLPSALRRYRETIEAASTPDFVVAGHETVNADGSRSRRSRGALLPDRRRNFLLVLHNRLSVCLSGSLAVRRGVFATLRFPESLRNFEDRVLLAHLVASFRGTLVDEPLAEVFAHADSLRHRLPDPTFEGRAVEALFDPAVLPPPFFRHRRLFATRLALSRFRRLFLAGRYREANATYVAAMKADPRVLLEGRYFMKFLRSSVSGLQRAAGGRQSAATAEGDPVLDFTDLHGPRQLEALPNLGPSGGV